MDVIDTVDDRIGSADVPVCACVVGVFFALLVSSMIFEDESDFNTTFVTVVVGAVAIKGCSSVESFFVKIPCFSSVS